MNILIDMPVYRPILDKLKEMKEVNVQLIEEPEEKIRSLPVEQIEDCNILFCTFPPANHNVMRCLEMIQISSSGFTQLVGEGFEQRNIKACNALGVFDSPIAEWNIAMMVNLARDLRGIIRNQESRIWDRSAIYQNEIRGKILGIWGYGGIGRETARIAKALGMTVYALTRTGLTKPRKNIYSLPGTGDIEGLLPDKVYSLNEKAEFVKELDFLVLALPLMPSTEGIIGKDEFHNMKSSVYILNPARGPLIQEDALLDALRKNWIAGAAIDTHYYYPLPKDHPLWNFKNVILTPHISGSSSNPNFLKRIWEIFYQNVLRLRDNKPLLNELSHSVLK